MWKRTSVLPIGLDLGRRSVKLLQAEASQECVEVRCAARHELPADAWSDGLASPAIGRAISAALRQAPFRGRRVAAAIPRHFVYVKSLRLPQMPPDELDSAARFEARNAFAFDAENAVLHALPAGEVRQGNDTLQEVLVLGVKQQDIDALTQLLHRAGVEIDSLDAEPCSLYRGVERFVRRREDEQEVHVLADVGASGTQVVIGRGRDITFLKNIEIGARHLDDAVSKGLGISAEEAAALRAKQAGAESRDDVNQAVYDTVRPLLEQLARELSLCLRYQSVTFRGHRPTKLRLMGGAAEDAHLHQVLKAALPIPIDASSPLINVDCARAGEISGRPGSWAVALGLALRRTAGKFRPRDGRPRAAQAADSETVLIEPGGAGPAESARGEVTHA